MDSMLLASFPRASSITTGIYCSKVTTLWHKTGKIQKEYCVMMSSRYNLMHRYKVTEGGSTCQGSEKKYVVKATSGQSFENEHHAQDLKIILNSVKDGLDIFSKFSRPFAAIGAALGATSVCFLAVEKLSDLSLAFVTGWLQVVVASFCMNIFNCGLNQLCDVEIDKINKPSLPLASGELSLRTGVIIVASSLIMSFWIAWIEGSWPLFWAFSISSMLGAAYSIDWPLLRWKKSPVLAAMNISINSAIARPLGYFLHIQTRVFKRPPTFTRPLIFWTAIMSLFFVVIALFKDIPDMEGDEKHGIQSLSLHLGQKRVFWICVSLLEMAYGVIILVGATSPFLWSKLSMGLGHATLALVLWFHAKSVDMKSNAALYSFYTFIWKLLWAEYFLIPLFR